MDYSKFCGVVVNYLDKEATITNISNGIITIKLTGDNYLRLSYPSAFFSTELTKQFLTTENEYLKRQLKHDTDGLICENCGRYSKSLINKNGKLVCSVCIKEDKEKYAICSHCGKKSEKSLGGKDCIGRFICKKCNKERQNSEKINMIQRGFYIEPKITVSHKLPSSCKNNHNTEWVRALVLYSKNGINTPHEIDLFYCSTCNRLFCLTQAYIQYEKRFGRLQLEHIFDNEIKNYLLQFGQCNRDYDSDSILSRWGYIAQENRQSQEERWSILSVMIDYDKRNKTKIASMLNYLIEDRGYRCYLAKPIWQSDLEFVLNYNENEPFINLT